MKELFLSPATGCVFRVAIQMLVTEIRLERPRTDLETDTLVHMLGTPIQPYFGPPSLTSSFAAAKPQSLLVLDVEIVDQPETE